MNFTSQCQTTLINLSYNYIRAIVENIGNFMISQKCKPHEIHWVHFYNMVLMHDFIRPLSTRVLNWHWIFLCKCLVHFSIRFFCVQKQKSLSFPFCFSTKIYWQKGAIWFGKRDFWFISLGHSSWMIEQGVSQAFSMGA